MSRNCPGRRGPAIHLAYNNAAAKTVVNRLTTGPADAISFSPIPGVLLRADPCGSPAAIEVQVAWARVRPDDAERVLAMLDALYGRAVARAAAQRYDSDMPVEGGRQTRSRVHRLLRHIDAMDRDHHSDELAALWWLEAELLAGSIDSRVPFAEARAGWAEWRDAPGADLALRYLPSAVFVPGPAARILAFGDEPTVLAAARETLYDPGRARVWCREALASTNHPGDPAAEAIAAAMLALRLERLGEASEAQPRWVDAETSWCEYGDRRRAALAVARAKRDPSPAPAGPPSLGELAGVRLGSSKGFGYRALAESRPARGVPALEPV